MTQILRRRIALLIFAIAVGLAQSWVNLELRELDAAWVEPPTERTEKWNPILFKLLTFGYWPAATDWLWMRTLQDSAISHVEKSEHAASYYDLDLATDLDPAFFEIYVTGGNLLAVIRNDITGARDLLLKGNRFIEKQLPDYPQSFRDRYWGRAWNLSMVLAYIYLFEMGDMPHAAEAFLEAANLPGAPSFLVNLGHRLERPDGQYEVGIRLLSFLIVGAKDPGVRQELEKKRISLFLGQYLFNVKQSFLTFLAGLPEYRNSLKVSKPQMRKYWDRFLKESKTSNRDPMGGLISLDDDGKLQTTTPHVKVYGLE